MAISSARSATAVRSSSSPSARVPSPALARPSSRESPTVPPSPAPPGPCPGRFRSGRTPHRRRLRPRRAQPGRYGLVHCPQDRRGLPRLPRAGPASTPGWRPEPSPIDGCPRGPSHSSPAGASRPGHPDPEGRCSSPDFAASPTPHSAAAVAKRSARSRSSSVIANRAASRKARVGRQIRFEGEQALRTVAYMSRSASAIVRHRHGSWTDTSHRRLHAEAHRTADAPAVPTMRRPHAQW